MPEIFDRHYVEGLRRECQRKGQRIRALELSLIVKAVELESLKAAIDPAKVKTDAITVDLAGGVHGAIEAVRAAASR